MEYKKKSLKNYKYKYDNSYITLALDYLTYFIEKNDTNTINGEYQLYIAVNLGDISYLHTHLHIINNLVNVNDDATSYLLDKSKSLLLKLPIFKEKEFDETVQLFLDKIKICIESGEYLSSNISPYRVGNEPIIIPKPFAFGRKEDVKRLYSRFIEYAGETEKKLLSEAESRLQGGTSRRRGRGRGDRGRK